METQINPHFLYNTLDTFRGLALENGDRHLSDMIEALSVMFKYSVNYDVEMVSMNAELNYLSKYIQLQQLRFPDRFEYQEVINCTPEQLLLEMCPRFVSAAAGGKCHSAWPEKCAERRMHYRFIGDPGR